MFGLNVGAALALGCAAVIAAVSVYAGIMKWQRDSARQETQAARQELSNYQAAATAVIQARLAAQQAAEKERDRKTREVTNEYKKRVDGINARLAAALERLRDHDATQDRGANAGLPGPTSAPGGVDGSADSAAIARELAACLTNSERLRALQEWVLRTH